MTHFAEIEKKKKKSIFFAKLLTFNLPKNYLHMASIIAISTQTD